MIAPDEIQELHDRDSTELFQLHAHITGILAARHGCIPMAEAVSREATALRAQAVKEMA